MNKKSCPVCGSEEIIEKKKTISINEPFIGQDNIEVFENICYSCKSIGDFFNQNESLLEDKIKELKQKSVKRILEYFIEKKISMSSIERALEMPQRTLVKWKNNKSKTSSAGIALIRFIRLFPWLLEVAENKYDFEMAQKIQIDDSINKLQTQKSVADWAEEFNYGPREYPKIDAAETFLTADVNTKDSESTVIIKENSAVEELLTA